MIDVDQLSVERGGRRVLNDLSFVVPRGQTYGFLGANGAGKTTTVRTMLGLLTPRTGSVRVAGRPYDTNRRGLVGYLPEERGLFRKERVLDVMTYLGRVHGLTKRDARRQASEFLDRCGIGRLATVRVDRLSGGQQQKVQFGIALLGSPEVLVLDEPTKGLDPLNRRLLAVIVEEHQRQGATVLLVTHDLAEVERSCQGVVLLRDGRCAASGPLVDVCRRVEDVVELVHRGALPGLDAARLIDDDGRVAHLTLSDGIRRTTRKPSFWVATLLLPAVAVVIGLLITSSTRVTADAVTDRTPFTYLDDSGRISPDVARQLGGTRAVTAAERRAARQASDVRPLIVFPSDLGTGTVQVFGPNRGPLLNERSTALVRDLVRQSAADEVDDPGLTDALLGRVAVEVHTTTSGASTRTVGEVIPPLSFAVVLFVMLLISGSRMLAGTLEEKENRVLEMILVGIRPLPMIAGKILALLALAGVQIVAILIPTLAVAGVLSNGSTQSFLDGLHLRFEPVSLAVSAVLLLGALALFTGALVAIGAITNSAKDAGPYYGAFVVLLILPVYAITTLLSDPDAVLVQAMLWFPFTTPLTALVLNATGALSGTAAALAMGELIVCGTLAIVAAAHLFRWGAFDQIAVPGFNRRR